MAGQKGRDVRVRIGDGGEPEAFIDIAGVRARTIALRAGLIDATTADSAGAWRRVIAGAAAKSVEVAGSGMFRDAASDAWLRAAFFDGVPANFELIIPDFGVLSGPFVVVELIYGGAHGGEATFSTRLASAGTVAFTAD